MATTTVGAQQRVTDFYIASKNVPLLSTPMGHIRHVKGPFSPARWGPAVSLLYRKAYPDRVEQFDLLDRLREEHMAANAAHAFRRELKRLEKLT